MSRTAWTLCSQSGCLALSVTRIDPGQQLEEGGHGGCLQEAQDGGCLPWTGDVVSLSVVGAAVSLLPSCTAVLIPSSVNTWSVSLVTSSSRTFPHSHDVFSYEKLRTYIKVEK